MIIDDITRADSYKLGETWQHVVDFMEKIQQDTTLKNFPTEAQTFHRCKAIFNLYDAKNFQDCKYEYHKKMVDLQFLIEGEEEVYLYPLKDLTKEADFDVKADKGFCLEKPEPSTKLVLNKNNFILIFPHEAHMPELKSQNYNGKLAKVIVKIPYEFLNIGA